MRNFGLIHGTQRWSCRLLAAAALVMLIGLSGAARAQVAEDAVARGRYLATAGDCVACHTAPDGEPFAGGLYMPTPFGQISTPNITPDVETGIGGWSDDDFLRAMHEGIGKEGEYLYPAFPFPWYTKVTREDALAIKSYLFSLPPRHAPREPLKLAFPFNVREGLLAWRTLFFRAGRFQPDAGRSEQWNCGAYLVGGLGHCGECHNRSKLMGASDWSGRFEGGEIEHWYAPNLLGGDGERSWTVDQLATYLKTGTAPGLGVAVGPMAETIEKSLSHLRDEDLQAMATYLKSLQDENAAAGGEATADLAERGSADVYLSRCAFCHGVDGQGVPGKIPALAGNGAVLAEGPQNVIRAVVGGLEPRDGYGPMPAVGAEMSDGQVAAAADYVRSAWGNAAPAGAQPGQVAEIRDHTQTLLAANLDGSCPSRGRRRAGASPRGRRRGRAAAAGKRPRNAGDGGPDPAAGAGRGQFQRRGRPGAHGRLLPDRVRASRNPGRSGAAARRFRGAGLWPARRRSGAAAVVAPASLR